jgi:hypothetical protein
MEVKPMRKILIGMLIGASITASTAVFADSTLQKIEAYLNPSLTIKLDGKNIKLKNPPITYDGTTYLPLREVSDNFNKEVKWNEATQTIELNTISNAKGAINMNETFYNLKDVSTVLRDKYYNTEELSLSFMRISVLNGKQVVKYKDKEYIVDDLQMFYDRTKDETYYSEGFYLQFLDSGILGGLTKYNIINGNPTPLN